MTLRTSRIYHRYDVSQVDEKNEAEDGDEVILNIKPMQPLVRASQYGYMRGLGLHQARTVPPSLHVSRLGACMCFPITGTVF